MTVFDYRRIKKQEGNHRNTWKNIIQNLKLWQRCNWNFINGQIFEAEQRLDQVISIHVGLYICFDEQLIYIAEAVKNIVTIIKDLIEYY